jgi:hypothetical protein
MYDDGARVLPEQEGVKSYRAMCDAMYRRIAMARMVRKQVYITPK